MWKTKVSQFSELAHTDSKCPVFSEPGLAFTVTSRYSFIEYKQFHRINLERVNLIMRIFYILIFVEVTQLYSITKIQQTIYLEWVDFIICKLYLYKEKQASIVKKKMSLYLYFGEHKSR